MHGVDAILSALCRVFVDARRSRTSPVPARARDLPAILIGPGRSPETPFLRVQARNFFAPAATNSTMTRTRGAIGALGVAVLAAAWILCPSTDAVTEAAAASGASPHLR